MTGAITTNSTFDGRDVATDGAKLDGIASSANNYVHPNHSGEVTSSADGATVIASNVIDADNLKVTGNGTTSQFLRSDGDGTFTWATPTDTDTVYTHPNHSGEVTSTADGATVIADDVVDEANLKVSNSPTNGYFLSAQSGDTGGLTWAAASGGGDPDLYRDNAVNATTPTAAGDNGIAIGSNAVNTTTHGSKNGLAIGTNAVADYWATALGAGTDATGNSSLAVGYNSQAIGTKSTAIMNSYASGTDSFAAAIANNTSSYGATGTNSLAIGDLAKATNTNAVCISNTSTASGANSAVLGGASGTASGSSSVVLGGSSNTASGINSTAKGYYGNTNGIRLKHATGVYPNMQGAYYVLSYSTTNETPIALNTSSWTPSAINQIILPNNSAYAFSGTIVARQQASAGTACAAWKVEGLIRREGSAGTTVLVNSATTVLDNTPNWGMALSADTTNGGLAITATGAASTNIRWVATINTSEVTY